MKNINYTYLLIFVLVLGLVLRLPHLFDKEQGTDEKLSIRNAHTFIDFTKHNTVERLYNALPNEVNPPLFFILLGLFLRIYDSVVVLKIFGVFIGVLSILVFYFLVKKLFDKRFALFSTFLYAMSPAHIIYSQHIRAYIFQILLFVLALYLLHEFLYKKNLKSLVYLTLVYIISFYSHYYSMLFVGSISLTVLLFYLIDRKIKILHYLVSLIVFFIAAIPGVILLNMQRLKLEQSPVNFLKLYEVPYPFYKLSLMTDVSTTLKNFPYLFVIFFLIVILTGYGLFRLYNETDKRRLIFIGANLIAPYAVLTLVGFFWPISSFRYLMFLLPVHVMTFSYGLFNIRNKLLRNILLGILLVGWAVVIWYYYSIATTFRWPEHIAI